MQMLDKLSIPIRIVRARHFSEHFGAAGLKRKMQVPAQPSVCCCEQINERFIECMRLNARCSNPSWKLTRFVGLVCSLEQ